MKAAYGNEPLRVGLLEALRAQQSDAVLSKRVRTQYDNLCGLLDNKRKFNLELTSRTSVNGRVLTCTVQETLSPDSTVVYGCASALKGCSVLVQSNGTLSFQSPCNVKHWNKATDTTNERPGNQVFACRVGDTLTIEKPGGGLETFEIEGRWIKPVVVRLTRTDALFEQAFDLCVSDNAKEVSCRVGKRYYLKMEDGTVYWYSSSCSAGKQQGSSTGYTLIRNEQVVLKNSSTDSCLMPVRSGDKIIVHGLKDDGSEDETYRLEFF